MCCKCIRSLFRKKCRDAPTVAETETSIVADIATEEIIPSIHTTHMASEINETVTNPGNGIAKEFLYLYYLIRFRVKEILSESTNSEEEKEPEFKEEKELEKKWWPQRKEFHPYLQKFFDEVLITDGDWESEKDRVKVLLITLAPYLYPDLFDTAIGRELSTSAKDPIQIGGVRGQNCRFFLPTGETALCLIAYKNRQHREKIKEIFGAESIFWTKKILWLEDMQRSEPPMHGRIIMSQDYVELLSSGTHQSPLFSISFPAKKIAGAEIKVNDDTEEEDGHEYYETGENEFESHCRQTKPDPWDQLVINDELNNQIKEIKAWLKFNDRFIKDFGKGKRFRQGFRALFFGPPGTGKTFTAQLLGKQFKKNVYKIDLSMVVSKYIGETEKNLELLFAKAEDKKWILFFDEADSLFGKRTSVRDAHDKYANQEVSYLLQRIEDYNGLIILATNMKNNIDDAFIRRFNSILKFPVPNSDERKIIWKKSFPDTIIFRRAPTDNSDMEIDIPEEVKSYELTGGNINNIVHYACLKGYERKAANEHRHCHDKPEKLKVYLEDVLNGIKKEFTKEGKPSKIN